MSSAPVTIRKVEGKADRKRFVDFAWEVYKDDPAWVPPLKDEVMGLITPGKNPWFGHARADFFLAERAGKLVGRISAQVDSLVLEHMEPGLGNWGMFEALDEEAALALIRHTEQWLREAGMTKAMGPMSLSVWDEPGLEIEGFQQAPTAMMGHHRPAYKGWIEKAGYAKAKDLVTYYLDISDWRDPKINRLIESGERNPRINIRKVDVKRFDEEAALILNLLNDAWSDNWGFVPLTPAEIAYAGKKLKPIIYPELVRIAEVDGEAVAFMLTIPDINELTRDLNGELFPFGFAKLLWRLRKPRVTRLRVPLMGVAKRFQSSRLASVLAFMMIEYTRRDGTRKFGATHGEFGWILEDNKGMLSIAQLPGASVNHRYRIFEKAL
ncbi:N-acetyltransferase [Sphingomonas ginkgonis]|uniref:N-acetyltransferase n=1 Tax=Sphingomonas ginkgonis TaxID=2315330 RepID=A0A429VDD3_9SPHN|nr:N-acetyltransferase [Sphingomonas ginkgonis]RST31943.1 N-acetyltransferase [Sphingomonas ginkgonis]